MKLVTLLLAGSATHAGPTKQSGKCAANGGDFESYCNLNLDDKSCNSGKLCCWSGESCHAKVETVDEVAELEGCTIGEGGKYSDLGSCVLDDEDFNKNLVQIQVCKNIFDTNLISFFF